MSLPALPLVKRFQFPPPRGGELDYINTKGFCSLFQFPPPRGGELMVAFLFSLEDNFNSRPREGANDVNGGRFALDGISIPAPARGRTDGPNCSRFQPLFQFPPPRGGEPSSRYSSGHRSAISIPAPARGRTPAQGLISRCVLFQFPPPRGGEPRENVWKPTPTYFNSRPREGANLRRAIQLVLSMLISIPAPARGRTQWSCRKA